MCIQICIYFYLEYVLLKTHWTKILEATELNYLFAPDLW